MTRKTRPILGPVLVGLTLAAGAGPALAEFPRQGVEGIPNGIAAPFVGHWSVGFPEGDGMINGQPVADCAKPVVLREGDGGSLVYESPKGGSTRFELNAFAGRTSWIPQGGESMLAVWTTPDEFYSYTVALTGSARWNDPRVFRRCR
ncbi:hypothetical protein [Zavarzinia sp. CC-PAN008]|uniref:hypothetical protein n=1 Tax=Zavarzinia sp. CC-PAN008 TaxID=3243332 RepID=UPI003F742972